MNDLAERAARLDVARRFVLGRPLPWLAGAGLLAGSLIVVVGGRIGAAPSAVPINSWLGLLPDAGYRVEGLLPGLLMLAGIAVLVGLWLTVLALVSRRRVRLRALWATAACWAVPFAVGPPLLGTDVYSSAAYGLLAHDDLSPYHHGPDALGPQRLVSAIDPTHRSMASTDGPLATALEHVPRDRGAGNPVVVVLLLRAVAVLAAIAIGRLAVELAGTRRTSALVATALNPAVLLYLVSGAQLAGAVAALLLGAFVRAGQRRWASAVVLACLAAGLEPLALVAVVALVAAHAANSRRALAVRIALRDAAIALVVLVACVLAVPYGLHWIGNLRAATHEHTWFAPSSVLSDVVSLIVRPTSYDDLAAGGRVAALAAAVTAVGWLLGTVRRRPLDRTVGLTLLAATLLAPVVHAWSVLPGLLCLAPAARGVLRDLVIALSAAACVLTPAGFATRTAELVTIGCIALVLCWLVPRLVLRRRATAAGSRVSAAA